MNLNNFKQKSFLSFKKILQIELSLSSNWGWTTLYLFDFLLMVSEKKYYFTKRATSVQFSWSRAFEKLGP